MYFAAPFSVCLCRPLCLALSLRRVFVSLSISVAVLHCGAWLSILLSSTSFPPRSASLSAALFGPRPSGRPRRNEDTVKDGAARLGEKGGFPAGGRWRQDNNVRTGENEAGRQDARRTHRSQSAGESSADMWKLSKRDRLGHTRFPPRADELKFQCPLVGAHSTHVFG